MSAPTAPVVLAAGLSRRFGRTLALAAFDLELPRGVACALVGRNGAGKSTALRLALGLLVPSSGSVRVHGLDPLTRRLELRRLTGIVLERHEAWQSLTVREVLRLASGLHPGWKDAEQRRLVARFELPLDSRVRALSRGQSAQLAFVIALAPEPRLLVLDEPTSGLDPIVRHLFVEEVRRAVDTRGASVLFTTHVMSDIDGAADEVVVVDAGSVLARGAPRALADRYSRVSLLFDVPPAANVVVPGARRTQRGVREIVATFAGPPPDDASLVQATGARDVRPVPLDFDAAFLEIHADARGGA